ncbi:MAG: transporter substrate-binding domain-containing protein, partial [Helicobacter sp.]|nr:transporter substrate-binding domain-containing protein [Helicobacter sp.]
INDPISALDYAKSQNIELTITNFHFEKTPVYLVFRKDSQELADIINAALEKAIKDGKISALSIQYFGIDQTK